MDKLVIGPDVKDLSPEQFEKKDKAMQARAEANWERAKAKGMSRKEYIEAMARSEIGASRAMAGVYKNLDMEPKVKIVRDDKGSRGGGSGRSSGGSGGGGGMFPDTERVPGKKQHKMKKGGVVRSSASKRADGIAIRGKTRA